VLHSAVDGDFSQSRMTWLMDSFSLILGVVNEDRLEAATATADEEAASPRAASVAKSLDLCFTIVLQFGITSVVDGWVVG
jgi:hypothetical protein